MITSHLPCGNVLTQFNADACNFIFQPSNYFSKLICVPAQGKDSLLLAVSIKI